MNNQELNDTLESILTADILILTQLKEIRREMNGGGGSSLEEEAICEIRDSRHGLIQRLISKP